jgi:hypothetical protein
MRLSVCLSVSVSLWLSLERACSLSDFLSSFVHIQHAHTNTNKHTHTKTQTCTHAHAGDAPHRSHGPNRSRRIRPVHMPPHSCKPMYADMLHSLIKILGGMYSIRLDDGGSLVCIINTWCPVAHQRASPTTLQKCPSSGEAQTYRGTQISTLVLKKWNFVAFRECELCVLTMPTPSFSSHSQTNSSL